MSTPFHIVVCGGVVPDPLQTLEPVTGPQGPSLRNEMMLPAVLDPWSAHALYEAANLAAKTPGSKVWLVSLSPKAKLQQVMMSVAQKLEFELVAVEGPASGFTDSVQVAAVLTGAIEGISGLDRSRLLVFGGWESASRGAGVTMQMVGERLGILDQCQGVDELTVTEGGSLRVLERIEGACQVIEAAAHLRPRQLATRRAFFGAAFGEVGGEPLPALVGVPGECAGTGMLGRRNGGRWKRRRRRKTNELPRVPRLVPAGRSRARRHAARRDPTRRRRACAAHAAGERAGARAGRALPLARRADASSEPRHGAAVRVRARVGPGRIARVPGGPGLLRPRGPCVPGVDASVTLW